MASTVKVAVAPAQTVWFAGCVVIAGRSALSGDAKTLRTLKATRMFQTIRNALVITLVVVVFLRVADIGLR